MNGTEAAPTPSGKRRTWLIVVPALLLVLIAAYMAWDNTYGASAKKRAKEREIQAQTERYHQYLKNFEDAMRADTYGGRTPEETLQLFIAALKAGDIDLASRYFFLETNENSPDYLTNNKWKKVFEQLEQNRLNQIVEWVSSAEPMRNQSTSDKDAAWFSVYGSSSESLFKIYLKKNTDSNVWKIQGL